jgi:hypothetical protein
MGVARSTTGAPKFVGHGDVPFAPMMHVGCTRVGEAIGQINPQGGELFVRKTDDAAGHTEVEVERPFVRGRVPYGQRMKDVISVDCNQTVDRSLLAVRWGLVGLPQIGK